MSFTVVMGSRERPNHAAHGVFAGQLAHAKTREQSPCAIDEILADIAIIRRPGQALGSSAPVALSSISARAGEITGHGQACPTGRRCAHRRKA